MLAVRAVLRTCLPRAASSSGVRWCASYARTYTESEERKAKIAEHSRRLQLQAEFSESDVREAFVRLAKTYHPDSRSSSACAATFSKIKEAYTYLINVLQNPEIDEQEATEDKHDIRHTAPQHRQFLSFEGVGYGTLAERQKQYNQFRAERANENVYEYRKDKSVRESENSLVQAEKMKKETRKIKTRNLIDRLVEDLIKESMAKGDFDNLPGAGKPLRNACHDNPYIDVTTYNLNKILINNGFAPEWITLEKEIKSEYRKLKYDLWVAYEADCRRQTDSWKSCIDHFRDHVKKLNVKIDRFNILAPALHLQMAHYSAEKAVSDILNGRYPQEKANSEAASSSPESTATCSRA